MIIKCLNRSCLFQDLDEERCTADTHNIMPSSNHPTNLCPRFLEDGLPSDKFANAYNFDHEYIEQISVDAADEYVHAVAKIRDIVRSRYFVRSNE